MSFTPLARSYAGSATAGSLLAAMNNSTTSFSSSTPLGWVDVTGGSFSGYVVVEVEPGTANAEKILCTYNPTTGQLAISQRNYDGGSFPVSSSTHASNSTFILVATATEFAETNAAVQALSTVLAGTNFSTTPGNVGVDISPNPGASRVAVGVDHTHNISSSSLNTWLTTTASGTVSSSVSIPATRVGTGALPSGVTLPATQLTSGALPPAVSASKTWYAGNTTAINGITGYNIYVILMKGQCSYTGASGNFTISATANGVTNVGPLGVNMTVSGVSYALSSFAIIAPGASTTFSAQLVLASTAGTPTFSNQTLIVIGIN